MDRNLNRSMAWLAGSSLLLAGCQSPPQAMPPVPPLLVAPDGSICPGTEEFDAAQIGLEMAPDAATRAARIAEYTSVTPLPPAADAASTRIRVRVPATGMHRLDTMLTLWRTDTGAWHAANGSKDYGAPPPLPVPIYNEQGEIIGADYPEPPAYVEGPIDPERGTKLDAFLADPCFIHGPDSLPYEVPVRTPGAPPHPYWTCPPDSAAYMAELVQAGQPARYLSQSCYMDFAVSGFLTLAAYSYPMTDNPE